MKKLDPSAPAFWLTGETLRLLQGVNFEKTKVAKIVEKPAKLSPGCDYGITHGKGVLKAMKLSGRPKDSIIGGFHVGLNGKIVSASIWDRQFRPTCHDPRGMVFVAEVRSWVDIYLLNTEPGKFGTSAAGKTIADGRSEILMPDGVSKPLTFWNAVVALARHGKQLLSRREFEIAMQGVEDGKNNGRDPVNTGHVPGLRSALGIEQATGCMWTWSRDVYNPDYPWMFILGGNWFSDASGPRQFFFYGPADYWGLVAARGRCDHLQPERSEAKA